MERRKVNNSYQPLYYTIAEDLRKSILEGKYNPGDSIPSENELAERYGTTRVTARKGLDMLEKDGIISVWHGKGYFVLSPEHNKFTLYFSESNKAHAFKFSKVTVAPPPEDVKTVMQLGEGQKVIIIKRTIVSGGKPVACDEKYIPYYRGRPLVEEEIKYAELPDVAAAKESPFAIRTEMELGAEPAGLDVAPVLGCSPEEPLLVACRYIIDQKGAVVGFGKMYMRREFGKLKASSGYQFG